MFPVGSGSQPRSLELSDLEGSLGSFQGDRSPPLVEPSPPQAPFSHETRWNAAVRLRVSCGHT